MINSVALQTEPIEIADWGGLLSFRPSPEVQQQLALRNHYVQRIERAWGLLSADYYPVKVTRMPTVDGHPTGPTELLNYVRKNINSFAPQSLTDFSAYQTVDSERWKSNVPDGSVLHINMKLDMGVSINTDDGSVVCAEASACHWVFSTVWTPHDLFHPVSGNRMFGFYDSSVQSPVATSNDYAFSGDLNRYRTKSFTFYTMGSDRAASVTSRSSPFMLFESQKLIWTHFCKNLVEYISKNNGIAELQQWRTHPLDWDRVKPLYSPKQEWVAPAPEDTRWRVL